MFHFHSTSLELNLIKKYIARIEKQQTPFSLVFGPLFSTRKASNIFRFPLKVRVIEVRLLIFGLLLSQVCYWDTWGSSVIKCLCFFVVFFFFLFSSAKKWKDCAIVPRGHWALNTMTTNCDPMRCSHTDHACYPSTPWQLTVIQWGVHMLITHAILMMIDVVMHGQGRVTWRTRDFAHETL